MIKDKEMYRKLYKKAACVQNRILEITEKPEQAMFWAGVAWRHSQELFEMIENMEESHE